MLVELVGVGLAGGDLDHVMGEQLLGDWAVCPEETSPQLLRQQPGGTSRYAAEYGNAK